MRSKRKVLVLSSKALYMFLMTFLLLYYYLHSINSYRMNRKIEKLVKETNHLKCISYTEYFGLDTENTKHHLYYERYSKKITAIHNSVYSNIFHFYLALFFIYISITFHSSSFMSSNLLLYINKINEIFLSTCFFFLLTKTV